MATVFTFKNAKAYTKALSIDPKLAMIPISMAADLLDVEMTTIQGYIRRGFLSEISIGRNRRWVGVPSKLIRDIRRERLRLLRDLVKEAKPILVEAAKAQKILEYNADLMVPLKLNHKHARDRDILGKVLGNISRGTNRSKGCMLSVLAVSKSTGMPNSAFFELAADLNLVASNFNEIDFFDMQKNLVYQLYK